ncbi:hypothetical protein SHANETTE_148 [Bacillus phage Shanette]|uniref:Uncharacterized protein n=1 Tax=Bacillus phage Shanette TaxID=1296656 RepID=S5MTE3_9CAUD|nr:hypothetical protein AVV46_gp149 [Bacillus phage Shanette]AGR47042.1 hypothetical protein SHANETTE_148 [Bacillus phage Shanette]
MNGGNVVMSFFGNIDSKLLEALQESTCFGIAHDESVPECQKCDVRGQCKARMEGANIPTPRKKEKKVVVETPKETKATTKPATKSDKPAPKKATSTPAKPKAEAKKKDPVQYSADMPDFKPMSFEALKDLASERNVEWKDYANDSITRMRLIMNLKKSYQ